MCDSNSTSQNRKCAQKLCVDDHTYRIAIQDWASLGHTLGAFQNASLQQVHRKFPEKLLHTVVYDLVSSHGLLRDPER
jgi:hypothetical protein